MKRLFVFVFAVVLLGSCNKPGCTDPDAVNYDSSANDEDGTCQYVPTLSTMPVNYNGGTTAESGGIISSDGGSEITLRGVCWSTSTNPTISDDTTINGGGTGQFISEIVNLSYSTTYYVRAYATNSNGTSYGNEFIISTENITLIPDPNFEQVLINLGYDNIIDGLVSTANIDTVTALSCVNSNISDLTGIEDFTALTYLDCEFNQQSLTNLDVSNNTALTYLDCGYNSLTNLDVSNNTALTYLDISRTELSSLDVSQNTALTELRCWGVNQLECLNVKNGNNTNFSNFYVENCPNINCIEVDDPTWSTQNWTNVDPGTAFSTNCNYPAGCF